MLCVYDLRRSSVTGGGVGVLGGSVCPWPAGESLLENGVAHRFRAEKRIVGRGGGVRSFVVGRSRSRANNRSPQPAVRCVPVKARLAPVGRPYFSGRFPHARRLSLTARSSLPPSKRAVPPRRGIRATACTSVRCRQLVFILTGTYSQPVRGARSLAIAPINVGGTAVTPDTRPLVPLDGSPVNFFYSFFIFIFFPFCIRRQLHARATHTHTHRTRRPP